MSIRDDMITNKELETLIPTRAGVWEWRIRKLLRRIGIGRRKYPPMIPPGTKCSNCGAVSPLSGRCSDGQVYCCVHCCFNPLGCRCKYGEFGVEETRQDFSEWPPDEAEIDY